MRGPDQSPAETGDTEDYEDQVDQFHDSSRLDKAVKISLTRLSLVSSP